MELRGAVLTSSAGNQRRLVSTCVMPVVEAVALPQRTTVSATESPANPKDSSPRGASAVLSLTIPRKVDDAGSECHAGRASAHQVEATESGLTEAAPPSLSDPCGWWLGGDFLHSDPRPTPPKSRKGFIRSFVRRRGGMGYIESGMKIGGIKVVQ